MNSKRINIFLVILFVSAAGLYWIFGAFGQSKTCRSSKDCDDKNVCTNDKCVKGVCSNTPTKGGSVLCYTGPAGTFKVGTCAPGLRRCSNGVLGPCTGEVLPMAETCAKPRRDTDCNGKINPENAAGCTVYYKDFDRDGYGAPEHKCLCEAEFPYIALTNGNDCNDSHKRVNPGQKEILDGWDNNCNGQIDEGFK